MAVGSAVGAIWPQRADRVFTIVTVLAEHRRLGAGSALYEAISAWAAERGLREPRERELRVADHLAAGERDERRFRTVILALHLVRQPGGRNPPSLTTT